MRAGEYLRIGDIHIKGAYAASIEANNTGFCVGVYDRSPQDRWNVRQNGHFKTSIQICNTCFVVYDPSGGPIITPER